MSQSFSFRTKAYDIISVWADFGARHVDQKLKMQPDLRALKYDLQIVSRLLGEG